MSTTFCLFALSYIARFARMSARTMHSVVLGSSLSVCVGTMYTEYW